MNIFQKFIQQLYDKYVFDDYIREVQELEMQILAKRYGIDEKDEKQIIEAMIDEQNEPLRRNYYAGKEDGYNKAIDDFNKEFRP